TSILHADKAEHHMPRRTSVQTPGSFVPGQNETHDPSLESFVTSAQAPGCDFTLQNLPFAIFRRKGKSEQFRGGVAIGDQVLDLAGICKRDLLSGEAREAAESCIDTTLNRYMALGPTA